MDHNSQAAARFLISYAHENAAHVAAVHRLCALLRAADLDVVIDVFADEERQDWALWMMREIAKAERVLVVASPRYRARFEATAPADEGRGVQLEGLLIREEILRDMAAGVRRFVPVLLPGGRVDDIPTMLQPYSATHYPIAQLTAAGVQRIVRLLRRDPRSAPAPPTTEHDRPAGPTAALRLVVSGGTAAGADEAVRELLAAGAGRAAVDFDESTRANGAMLSMSTDVAVPTLARVARGVRTLLSRRTADHLVVTVGGHVADAVDVAAADAEALAVGPTARRMHAAPGAGLVVVVSSELHRLITAAAAPYPAARSYRQGLAEGDARQQPVLVAVPGRTVCPDLPPAAAAPLAPAPEAATPAPAVRIAGDNLGAVGDGNAVTYNGPVNTGVVHHVNGPVVNAGRDAHVSYRGRP
jgi:SEFIR domain